MSSIFDAVLLVRYDKTNAPGIMKTMPEGMGFGPEALMFCPSCWPFPEESYQPEKLPLIYSFNVGSTYYHGLLFTYKDDPHAVIISTRRPFASLLHGFLKEVRKQFSLSGALEPTCSFAYVTSMLASWPRGAVESAVLTFPTSSLAITFDISHFSYLAFSPERYFTAEECLKIWRSLFTGTPILIITPSADIACRVCFATFSLMSPLLYDDETVIWLQKSDPRYKEIMEGSTKYKVVATSYEEIEKCPQFKLKYHINHVKKSSVISQGIQEHTSNLTTRVLKLVLAELDNLLNIDAYADFVDRPFATEHLRIILREFAAPDFPPYEDFILFEKTETFKRWRHAQSMRDILRHALLSYTPDFGDRSVEDLLKVIEGIESIKVKFWNDAHVQAVIRKHENRVVKLLNKKKEN